MKGKVLARISEAEPWGGDAQPTVNRALTPSENSERALTPGPWRQDWPFHCFYCSGKYSDTAYYPYCSSQCGLYAETDNHED